MHDMDILLKLISLMEFMPELLVLLNQNKNNIFTFLDRKSVV